MDIELEKYIDHTQLKPDATKEMLNKIIAEAKQYKFATVCVNPHWVAYSSEELINTGVKVCTVIGFPLGAVTTDTKVFETKQAIKNGATELDMVINIGELKAGNDDFVKQDIKSVVDVTNKNVKVKVIIETSLLTKNEKVRACLMAKEAQADFVKTSTGFSGEGATVEDIELMRQTVGPTMGIKASGGIRDLDLMNKMIAAGATRIGASASVNIIKESKGE